MRILVQDPNSGLQDVHEVWSHLIPLLGISIATAKWILLRLFSAAVNI